ncbi:hypothetical protein LGM61_26830 [Burkholderia cepacia]|nr:hypothetical protein [Burkholderia cepacia]HDR9795303.1 hypothetical protein [Burkholderia cepacia ATCC 25416]
MTIACVRETAVLPAPLENRHRGKIADRSMRIRFDRRTRQHVERMHLGAAGVAGPSRRQRVGRYRGDRIAVESAKTTTAHASSQRLDRTVSDAHFSKA